MHKDIIILRELGWSLWDPIGLKQTMGGWRGEPFEDEYDRYLIETANMIQCGRNDDAIVDYLFLVQSQRMGLGPKIMNAEIYARLLGLIQAIRQVL